MCILRVNALCETDTYLTCGTERIKSYVWRQYESIFYFFLDDWMW